MYRYAALFAVVLLFSAVAGAQVTLAPDSAADDYLYDAIETDLEGDDNSVAPDVDQLPDDITVTHNAMVPEPATLGMLAFGSLTLLRRRE